MKLYVIRHGRTDCNNQKKYNCRYDEDINEVFDNDFDMMMYDLYNIDIDDYLDINLRIEIEKEWNKFIQNKIQ